MSAVAADTTAHIRIDHHSAVHVAANAARSSAVACGLPGPLPERAAVLASELATNVVKHARDGALYIQPVPHGTGVQIIAVDRGPGMADPARCMDDGYTSTGSLGSGLGAVRRMAGTFTIRSQVGRGTLACAEVTAPGAPAVPGPPIGALCLPAEGEQECGDSWAVAETGEGRCVALVDGLGHGHAAAQAAQAAVRAFRTSAARPLPEVLRTMHRALRHTRGAAVALGRLRPAGLEYCAIGNVRAALTSPDGTVRRLAGRPGVVGWNLPEPYVEQLATPTGSSLVVHSDGIGDPWAHQPPPALLRLPAPLLAASLVHGHRLRRDDATVVVTGTARPDAPHP
ncbi:SpoIIE family protein phosphatase [Streptomyces indicus]|uniref:Anti-sigma regulatory factor (Ser/Thr protein kinase) n=1 Tax=Streptomyces indicus TaxID=417292 RepID=A0A1G8UP17_9ACTN|nr:SpoIIE family protein phosphatase [Streptomyces indicus]SDJ55227.1 Anti-sigma regulatory factor (Ser/Thr protein kinase) [Streptomyces indicus]